MDDAMEVFLECDIEGLEVDDELACEKALDISSLLPPKFNYHYASATYLLQSQLLSSKFVL